MSIDRAKAAALGVSVEEVANDAAGALGGQDVSEFERGNKRYDVVVQLQNRTARPREDRPLGLRARRRRRPGAARQPGEGRRGRPVPRINHCNRRRSVTIGANLEGMPLGEALQRVRALADSILPERLHRPTWPGESRRLPGVVVEPAVRRWSWR